MAHDFGCVGTKQIIAEFGAVRGHDNQIGIDPFCDCEDLIVNRSMRYNMLNIQALQGGLFGVSVQLFADGLGHLSGKAMRKQRCGEAVQRSDNSHDVQHCITGSGDLPGGPHGFVAAGRMVKIDRDEEMIIHLTAPLSGVCVTIVGT